MFYHIAPRRSFIALLILVGGALLPFLPNFLFGTIPYEDDIANYFWPVLHRVAESLRAGRLPLWTPNIYTGFPLFADPEAGTLFPLNWLLVLLNEPFGLLLLLCLTTTLTAICMYAYARHLGYGHAPSLIAAWMVALGGFATGHRVHLSIGNSALTMPLVLLAVDRVLLARGRRQLGWALVVAVAHAAQWLGGHLQPPILTWLLVGAYLVFRLTLDPLRGAPARTLRQKIFVLMALPSTIGVLSFGLAAAQLLPTLELVADSARALDTDYAFATSYSFPPFNLVTFIWPYFFQDQSGARWGLWSHWETAAYVGILPLMLAISGLVFRRNRLTIFFALVALASLWLAMADYAPLNLHRWLSALPIVSVLRAPARFVFLCDVALAVLAANGAQWLLTADLRVSARQARRIAAVAILSVTLLIAADFIIAGWIGAEREATMRWLDEHYSALPNYGLPYPPSRLFDFLQWAVWLGNPQFAFGVVWLWLSVGWLALSVTGRLSLRARRVSALLLVLADLSVFAATFWQTAPFSALTTPHATVQWLRAHDDGARVFSWPQSPTVPDRLLRWDVPDANGYSALEMKRHAQLIDAMVVGNNRLLDLANVGWIVRPLLPQATPAATELIPVCSSAPSPTL